MTTATKILIICLLIPAVIWDLYWKARALWKASRANQLGWFIALLIVNSVGILPLFYLHKYGSKEG